MQAAPYTVLILGGYGTFGRRICECLANEADLSLIIAGRNRNKADELCQQLQDNHPALETYALELDVNHPDFEQDLRRCNAQLVIHTCGPFQSQGYQVAEACIATGKHYIDLADDREFVCNFEQLDQRAKNAGVLLISGASSVPGLSAAVIDNFIGEFSTLKKIDYAISPGNKLDRGYATIKAILSYTGHPFTIWQDDQWRKVYGWMDSTKRDFGPTIGQRLIANINIPDLELFPKRYPSLSSVRFGAGLELKVMHRTMALMAWLAKKRLVNNWGRFTQLCLNLSRLFYPFGTDTGGMQMTLEGQGFDNKPLRIDWRLIAENGVGPFIPTIASILVTRELANQRLTETGARPCLGLFSLGQFMAYASQWGIQAHTEKKSNDTHQ